MVRFLVFFNDTSGSAARLHEVKAAFRRHKVNVAFHRLSQLEKQVKKVAGQRNIAVVAAGGDGTVNAVVNAVKDTGLHVGVLPLGTLNHFAKDIGMPEDPTEAVIALLTGKITQVDVAEVNGQLFVNNSSIGIYPSLVARRDALQPRFGKKLASIIAFLITLVTQRWHHVQCEYDRKKTRFRTPFVFVGNNHYSLTQNNFTNRQSLDSGALSIYILLAASFAGRIQTVMRSLKHGAKNKTGIRHFATRELTIHLRHKTVKVAFDGEVRQLSTPLRYQLHAKKLTIITPKK